MSARIGVDVGGTFTDFTLVDGAGGVVFHKTPSTPADPSIAVIRGLTEICAKAGIAPGDVGFVGHGTTVATNMIIERRGAETGLLTTGGFRDVLGIARQTRPHLYDYSISRPPPVVKREHRIGIDERLDSEGYELAPLDQSAVRDAAAEFVHAGIEAVAICFLHAYRNADHEQRAAAIVRELLPDAFVSISSEVLGEFREFERSSVTALNVFVGPRMQAYLDRLGNELEKVGIGCGYNTIHSNGGLMSLHDARRFPVRTCLSGPAAGVVGAAIVAARAGYPDVVTFDVGGTSTDVSLIVGGEPLFTSERSIAGYPVRLPMVDVNVIGAGGGSIARVDDAGGLKVGPESAGADPGPVAYGRGGDAVTLTDAFVTLSWFDPGTKLAGSLPLDAKAGRSAVVAQIGEPLGLSAEQAGEAIVRVAVANIARAIRSVSVERGHDLRSMSLFACGGAGPVLATLVADEVDCPRVIVPEEPGTLCARGILLSDMTSDYVRTLLKPCDAAGWNELTERVREMREEAESWFEREEVVPGNRRTLVHIDSRYAGQNFEIPVVLDAPEDMDASRFAAAFAERHHQEYGYIVEGRGVELVNCRLRAIGSATRIEAAGADTRGSETKGIRSCWFGDSKTGQVQQVETTVLNRDALSAAGSVPGPVIVEDLTSTTVVAPGWSVRIDGDRNLILERSA